MSMSKSWQQWFGKEHDTVQGDREVGLRSDYAIIMFPKYEYLPIVELYATVNNLVNILLNSFKSFIVCPKIHTLTFQERESHYDSYQAIEVGCPSEEWGHLRELISSIGVDFIDDQVMCACKLKSTVKPESCGFFYVSTAQSKNSIHLYLHSPDAQTLQLMSYADYLADKFNEERATFKTMPKMSVERVFVFCNKDCHPLGRGIGYEYLELMFKPGDEDHVNRIVNMELPRLLYDENAMPNTCTLVSACDASMYFKNLLPSFPA